MNPGRRRLWPGTGSPGRSEESAAGDLDALGRHPAQAIGHQRGDGVADLLGFADAAERGLPGRILAHTGVIPLPYFTSVQQYLESEREAGNADVPNSESAANQFLGMIANYVLWPRMLLTDWNPAASDVHYAVEQAVETTLARYASDRTV